VDREPGNDDRDFIARRRKANIRLAVFLALVAAAVYLGFILSYI
jgi:hypothetical protein